MLPEFFGTVRNFEDLSPKKTRSFGSLNCLEFRTLSRICPDLTSRCVAVDQNTVDHLDVFAHRQDFLTGTTPVLTSVLLIQ